MHLLKLYTKYIILSLKSGMEYRFIFFVDVTMSVFTYSITYLSLWVVFEKFHSVSGWGYYEVMFLYNLNLFSYGICGLFLWAPLQRLENMVRRGTFDSMLIRPISPFLHIIFRQFNYCFLGHSIISMIVFGIALPHLSIIWDVQKVFLFLLVVAGGVLIQTGIMVAASSLCFWFTRANSAVDTAIYNLRSFTDYPITIYARWVQAILTIAVPYAFVNFYPATLFLSKDSASLFHPLLQYGTPLVGIVVFALGMKVWRLGVGRYQSAGS